MKKLSLALLLVAALSVSLGTTPVGGDDTEIYTLQELPPNVLIVLDHSGSMENDDAGGVYDDAVTYVPWVGMPDLGNYDNWYNYNRTRWQIAKNVITHLLDETEEVRFGLIRMDGSSYNTGTGDDSGSLKDRMRPPRGITYTPGDPSGRVLRQGGKILSPVGMDKNLIIDVINQMANDDPQTYTILAETLYTAGQYFADGNDGLGMGAYKEGTDYTYRLCTGDEEDCEEEEEEEGWTSYQARTTDDEGHPINTSSPIEYWCQPNFVILMTDGQSNHDDDWSLMTSVIGDYDGDGEEAITANRYLDDVAKFLYEEDLRADMEGKQNIVTYTIAFSMTDGPAKDLVESAAEKGGGQYYTADNFDQLKYAFQNILSEILEISTSYTAPVIPISQMERTSSGSSVYLSLFKPTRNAFWKGNVKKFGLATADSGSIHVGDVIDKNGNLATDANGRILDAAVSYWGSSPDGGETELGGVGEVLLNRTATRNIYTWTKEDMPLAHPNNAFDYNNPKLSPAMFGVSTQAEMDQIMDFVYGLDAYDDDSNGSTTEKRPWILGSFIHSAPEIVHYDSTTTVIYAGSNDGLFHAFDDATGEELWAFVRPDLIAKLQNLHGPTMQYFYDARPRAFILDNNQDGDIKKTDNDKVVLVFGERRGGNYTYTVDATDPNDPVLMWYTGPEVIGFEEMGQSWCTPVFGKIAYGTKDVVFLSAGFDTNQDDDPVVASDTMGRGIYVVDLMTGDLIWKYTHAEDANMEWSIPSDMAVVDTTGSGYIDRLYVGDMGGQMWRFDIEDSDTANWTGSILFNASSSITPGDPLRKIFYPPDVTQEEYYEFVFFGTGDRAHPKETDVTNRIYAVKDRNTGTTLLESDLIDVTQNLLQDPGYAGDKGALRNQILSGDGWYITLSDNLGEKVLASSLVFGGASYLTTFTPSQEGIDDPCDVAEGTARLYALAYRTGEAAVNFDTTNDGMGADLQKSDRSLDIGTSIPSGMVIAIIEGKPHAYVGVRGGILKPTIANTSPLERIWWKEEH
jgi:type IV pilus assembly protein PilY1